MTTRLLYKALPAILLLLPACSSENFEHQGDKRLVGEWSCTPPNIITEDPNQEMEISIVFKADGTSSVTMEIENRTIFEETSGAKFRYSNLYRVEGEKMIEKQTSSEILSYHNNGEEITGYALEEFEKGMAEDVGKVETLQLEFLSDGRIIIDESTDNVICERTS